MHKFIRSPHAVGLSFIDIYILINEEEQAELSHPFYTTNGIAIANGRPRTLKFDRTSRVQSCLKSMHGLPRGRYNLFECPLPSRGPYFLNLRLPESLSSYVPTYLVSITSIPAPYVHIFRIEVALYSSARYPEQVTHPCGILLITSVPHDAI